MGDRNGNLISQTKPQLRIIFFKPIKPEKEYCAC